MTFRTEFQRSRYADNWLKLCPSEAQVQSAILQHLAWRGVVAVPVDAGAKVLRGRAVALARRLGATKDELAAMNAGRTGAGLAGLADIVGTLRGGRALYLEVKRPLWLNPTGSIKEAAGEATTEQIAFLGRMETQGAVVGIAWSMDDLKDILPP